MGDDPKVMVSSGGGDNMMGAIGSGNVKSGMVTVSLGTSGTLYSFSASPVIDPQARSPLSATAPAGGSRSCAP